MEFWELFTIAVGLSMDAFAVAVCKGLAVPRLQWRHVGLAGLYFGGFQAAMPWLGYLLGKQFADLIVHIDHWIAFFLLALIGGNMILESRGKAERVDASFSPKTMIPMAVATSIDALAVGVTFAFLQVQIVPSVCTIGITTFLFSALGIWIGKWFGCRLKSKAELFGGLILVLIGCKILLEHILG